MVATDAHIDWFLAGEWVDVTDEYGVLVRDSISAERGQRNWGPQVDHSRAAFSVRNDGGALSASNPLSPYFGDLGLNTLVRVRVGDSWRMHGELSSLPNRADQSASNRWVPVEATGILKRLRQGPGVVTSVLARWVQSQREVVQYWPCEELAGSRRFASAVGGPPLSIALAEPNPASNDDFPGSRPIPTLNLDQWRGNLGSYTASTVGFHAIRWLMAIDAGGSVNGQTILQVELNRSTWLVRYETGGTLRLEVLDGNGSTIDNETGLFAGGLDGEPVLMSLEPDVTGGAWEFHAMRLSDLTGDGESGTASAAAGRRVTRVTVSPDGGLDDIAIGHIHVMKFEGTAGHLGAGGPAALYAALLRAWEGEPAQDRIRRLCSEHGIDLTLEGRLVDELSRTEVDGWGTADGGGWTWENEGGADSDYSVAGGVGLVEDDEAGGATRRVLIPEAFVSANIGADLEALWSVSIPEVSTGNAAQASMIVREDGANTNMYIFRIIFGLSANVQVRISIRDVDLNGGVETTLIDAPGSQAEYAGGTVIHVRMRIVGDRLMMRCWADGDAEPGDWQAEVTDATHADAGRIGLRSSIDTGWAGTTPLEFTWHRFEVATFEPSAPLGPQPNATLPALIEESAASDGGILYEPADVFGLGYRTLANLTNQAPALLLDYAAGELAAQPEPTFDDQNVRNDVTVTNAGGGTARAQLETGRLSVAEPPAGVGRYEYPVDVNVYDQAQADQRAGWELALGTVELERFPLVTLQLDSPAFTSDSALTAAALGVRMGDRIVIANLPDHPDDVSLLVIGITEEIGAHDHRLVLNCVPELPYQVGIYTRTDDDYDRYDTAGCELAEALDTTETGVDVTTTSGPRWVDTTNYPDEFPFDVIAGGERMTCTAITGTTASQTMTVTRSVNGVVKTHAAGADVRLADPAYYALS
jgi:hypothetical protein